MFTYHLPTDEFVRAFLERQRNEPFSYDPVGVTRGDPPRRWGWNIDRHRVLLGRGEQAFMAACEAITAWQMFPQQMAQLYWPTTPLHAGNTVAVRFWAAPLRMWMLFPARIAYTVDDELDALGSRVRHFGFAYGTLPDHAERGEERFLVEWRTADDSVWYDLLAVSQPAHWLAKLGYPYTRYQQARFRRLSGEAMQRAAVSPS